MTGAPIPEGANAVLPFEMTEQEDTKTFAVDSIAEGKHVGQIGEDLKRGDTVLRRGRRLRPQDVGIVVSIGLAHVNVIRKPAVKIVVTGNELLPPGSRAEGFNIVDSNSPMLASLVVRDGGQPSILRLPDDPDEIEAALLLGDYDIALISGGSSVGAEDYAPSIVDRLGQLDFHGIAMRPSSPTGVGRIDGRFVFLLPGNPVSCLCGYDFFAGRAIRMMAGYDSAWPYSSKRLVLSTKIVSAVGRTDYARVKVQQSEALPMAVSGASMLSSTVASGRFCGRSARSRRLRRRFGCPSLSLRLSDRHEARAVPECHQCR